MNNFGEFLPQSSDCISLLLKKFNIDSKSLDYSFQDNNIYLSGELRNIHGGELAAHEIIGIHQELKSLGSIVTDLKNWIMTDHDISYIYSES